MTALLSEALTPASFDDFGLPEPMLAALDEAGITQPFAIQAATLPDALAGRDILGRAKTGSGKTLGFSLPLVARLAGSRAEPWRPRGLVLVPTRELATQVQRVLRPLAAAMDLSVVTVFGGTPFRPQIAALRRGTDIIVACPGRLADLVDRGHCDLSSVAVTVLDEADHMADLGFLPVVRRLLEATPPDGQRLLFSATLDSAVDVLARRFLSEPARHSVDEAEPPAEMTHHLLTVAPAERLNVLVALAGGDNRSLIFTRTKYAAKRLARQLSQAGIPAVDLHGDLTQNARSRNLTAFSSGEVRVLVATDIAARGIHVDGVDLVIHADPPAEEKAYLHRSGRTARGGADGTVVTLQSPSQAGEVRKLMRKAGVQPSCATVDASAPELAEITGPQIERIHQVRAAQPAEGRTSGRPKTDRPKTDRPKTDRPKTDRNPASHRKGGSADARRSRPGTSDSRGAPQASSRQSQSSGKSQRPYGRSQQSSGRSQQVSGRSRQAPGRSRQASGRSRQAEVWGRGA